MGAGLAVELSALGTPGWDGAPLLQVDNDQPPGWARCAVLCAPQGPQPEPLKENPRFQKQDGQIPQKNAFLLGHPPHQGSEQPARRCMPSCHNMAQDNGSPALVPLYDALLFLPNPF